jgi:anti-sigma factor RsiW
MTHNRRIENSAEHHEVFALLPWYVNATLEEADRQRVEMHLGNCTICREDLAAQQRICEAIEAQPALDYMPVASLKRLQARLDAQAESAAAPARPQPQPQEQATNRMPWRGWMAASIAAMAVAVALFAADRWVLDARLQP